MTERLPQGYEFVSDLEIGTDELLDLFKDVADESPDAKHGVRQKANRELEIDFTLDPEELLPMALGVRNVAGKLIGYSSASIDERSGRHAMVNYMLIHPAEAGFGVGKALADEGLQMLDKEAVKSISFIPVGESRKLVPYLTSIQGFVYDALNQEYISNRSMVRWHDDKAETEKPALPVLAEDETLSHPVTQKEMKAFQARVTKLVKATLNYVRLTDTPVLARGSKECFFIFDLAGRDISVYQQLTDDYNSWRVGESASAELVASPQGLVMSTDRIYGLEEIASDSKLKPVYEESLEIKGPDGAMRPFNTEEDGGGFTRARYEKVMSILSKLGPEHLIPIEETWDD